MTAHNSRRINWESYLQGLEVCNYTHKPDRFTVKNMNSLEHFIETFFNTIEEFNESLKKRRNGRKEKNNFIKRLSIFDTNKLFNPSNWNRELKNKSKEFQYKILMKGETNYFGGSIGNIINVYVLLNLFLITDKDRSKLPLHKLFKFRPCSSYIPLFLILEFNIIMRWAIIPIILKENSEKYEQYELQEYINDRTINKTELTREDVKRIKDFCSVLFRIICEFHRIFEIDYDDLVEHSIDSIRYEYYFG